MQELESQVVARLTAIWRQLWAMLSMIVVVTGGGAAWMTQTDFRLSGVESAVTLLSTGHVADLTERLRSAEQEIALQRAAAATLDRRLDRLTKK